MQKLIVNIMKIVATAGPAAHMCPTIFRKNIWSQAFLLFSPPPPLPPILQNPSLPSAAPAPHGSLPSPSIASSCASRSLSVSSAGSAKRKRFNPI